jgi:hypothetical protein
MTWGQVTLTAPEILKIAVVVVFCAPKYIIGREVTEVVLLMSENCTRKEM